MKRILMCSIAAALGGLTIAATGAGASARAEGFAEADKSLALAATEAQAGQGGTVLEIDRNGRDAAEPYRAVVLDPNGVLQHVAFDLPVDWMYPVAPVTKAQFTHTGALVYTKVRMIDAIRTAEDMAGARADKAEFVASTHDHVVAYRVTFGGPQQRTIVIDARSGAPIQDPRGLNLTT